MPPQCVRKAAQETARAWRMFVLLSPALVGEVLAWCGECSLFSLENLGMSSFKPFTLASPVAPPYPATHTFPDPPLLEGEEGLLCSLEGFFLAEVRPLCFSVY